MKSNKTKEIRCSSVAFCNWINSVALSEKYITTIDTLIKEKLNAVLVRQNGTAWSSIIFDTEADYLLFLLKWS